MKLKTTGFLLYFSLASASSWGQEANLNDTLSWLQAFIQNHSRLGWRVSVQPDECKMRVIHSMGEGASYAEFNLAKLKLHGISAGSHGNLSISGDPETKAVTGGYGPVFNKVQMDSGENAQRAVKALKHAAELCGATGVKEDIF